MKLKVRAVLVCGVAVAMAVLGGSNALASPLDARVSVIKRGELLRVSLTTPEGAHKFILDPSPLGDDIQYSVDAASLSLEKPPAALFAGRLRKKASGGVTAAVSMSADGFVITFLGKRGRRFYAAQIVPPRAFLESEDGAFSANVRLSHISRHVAVRCALSLPGTPVAAAAGVPFLGGSVATQVFDPPRILEISTDADWEFYRWAGKTPERAFAKSQAILNAAQAIFSSQLGITFRLKKQHVFTSTAQPYRSSLASDLLLEFQGYTNRTRHLGDADIYHLFSAKSLLNNVLGISFLGSACQDGGSFSYSMSDTPSQLIHFLVTAHEFGHVLGANHPEERVSPVPTPSLMTGIVRAGQDRFSDFSVDEIISYLDDHGACLSVAQERLLIAGKKNNTFNVAFGPILTGSSQCSFDLFASDARRGVDEDALGNAIRVVSSRQLTETLHFRPRASRSGALRRKVFFRARLSCSSGTRLSNPLFYTAEVASPGDRHAIRRWLGGLQLTQ